MDPSQQLRQMVTGYQVTQAVYVAARLGLSDLLAVAPRTVADLARSTSTHEPTLGRLLRALASVGIYEQDAEGRFANTELGELLRADVPGSIEGWAAFAGRMHHWQAWAGLHDSVLTGDNAFTTVHGTSVWEYRQQRPEEQVAFDRAMTSRTRAVTESVLDAFDFARFGTVADVGGGVGGLLAAILERYPTVHGVLFDQPDVVEAAGEMFERAGVADRYEKTGGSFFEAVPPGVDAYLLKAVIHDWSDEDAIAILRVCRRSASEDSALLLVEQLLGQGPDPRWTAFSDLNMLVGPGGQERTLDEYRVLLEAAGWSLNAATQTRTFVFVIEARPIAASG